MPADISAVAYFAPIATFLIVFIVIYAVLLKTKILGDNKWVIIFTSFLIASIFISVAGARTYVQTIVPWFAILILSLVFLLMITGIVGKPAESFNRGISLAFIIAFAIIFLIAGFLIFSHYLSSYVPGPNYGNNVDTQTMSFFDWLYTPRVGGAVILIIISVAVTWVLVKAK